MATIQDVLITELRLAGLAQYLAGLGSIALAIRDAAAEQDKLFRTGLLFNRLGLASSFDATTHAVDRMARRTGYARNEIEQFAGQLAQAGIRAAQIPGALQAVADAAAGNAQGFSYSETGDAFIKGVLGKERALERFGITLQGTGSRMANLNRIETEFARRFLGDAGLRGQTMAGALDRLSTAFNHFYSTLGNMPAVVHILNRLADGFDYLSDHLGRFFDFIKWFSPLLFSLNKAAERDHEGNPAAAVGKNGGLATEKTTQQIADNTKMTSDAIHKLFGGPGFRANQAFTFRDMRLALSI